MPHGIFDRHCTAALRDEQGVDLRDLVGKTPVRRTAVFNDAFQQMQERDALQLVVYAERVIDIESDGE